MFCLYIFYAYFFYTQFWIIPLTDNNGKWGDGAYSNLPPTETGSIQKVLKIIPYERT